MQQPFVDNLAYDRDLEIHVPFTTKSDAMLASLLLYHHISASTMKLVLSVVKHPSFNLLEVSLSSPEDVFTQAAHEKSLKHVVACTGHRNRSPDFPRIILDGVAEALGHEMADVLHSHRDSFLKFQYTFTEFVNPVQKALMNMTLVHSTWTQSAQRALGRVLLITGLDFYPKVILRALRGPLYGPWTREVIIHSHTKDGVATLSLRRIERLVLQMTRLNSLCVIYDKCIIQDWLDDILLRNLHKYQHSLETLVLVSSEDAFIPFQLFMDALGRLYRLRSLAIGQFSPPEDKFKESHQFNPSPPPSLCSITLRGSQYRFPFFDPAFSGLFLPRESAQGGFSLQTLSFVDIVPASHRTATGLQHLVPMFSRLQRLHIQDDVPRSYGRKQVTLIVPLCKGLRELTITPVGNVFSENAYHIHLLTILPSSLTHLHLDFSSISYRDYYECWMMTDEALCSLVESQLCPALTTITVSPKPGRNRPGYQCPDEMPKAVKNCELPKAMSTCKERHINLQIRPDLPLRPLWILR